MTLRDQVNITSFISLHLKAWAVVEANEPDFKASLFAFHPDMGSWVLYGNPGEAIRFRMYGDDVVAVILPSRVFVLVGGEYIAA